MNLDKPILRDLALRARVYGMNPEPEVFAEVADYLLELQKLLGDRYSSTVEENEELNEEVRLLEKKVAELESERDDLQIERDDLESERDALRDERDELLRALEEERAR